MVAECKICGVGLDDQDIVNAGMEEICNQCWDKRYKEKDKRE